MKLRVGDQPVDLGAGGTPPATPPLGPDGARRPDGAVRVVSHGVVRSAYVAGDQVWIDGRVRRVRPVASASAAPIPDRVTPPMPATVVKVLVAVGDVVEQGQKLVTVAAMKMETALRSPRAGAVTQVNAAPGQQVRPGDELVVVK